MINRLCGAMKKGYGGQLPESADSEPQVLSEALQCVR